MSEAASRSEAVSSRLAGTSDPQQILAGEGVPSAAELIDDVAAALAGLHRMDTRTGLVPSIDGPLQRRCGRPMSASVSRIRRSSWRFARWRADRRRPRALVHGDFRMGNLMVGGAGLTGVPRA